MFQDQIITLTQQWDVLDAEIKVKEAEIAKMKAKLVIIKRATRNLEKLEEGTNEQLAVSDE